jgi:hypothetical protein
VKSLDAKARLTFVDLGCVRENQSACPALIDGCVCTCNVPSYQRLVGRFGRTAESYPEAGIANSCYLAYVQYFALSLCSELRCLQGTVDGDAPLKIREARRGYAA